MTAVLLSGGRATADSRELFIGNSLTWTNDLPNLVGQLRAVSGAPMDYSQSSAIMFGVGLDWHWSDTGPQGGHALLAPGGWDGVVLQDYSLNATDDPDRTRTYARLWDQEIKAKAPDAVTYLFAYWQRQDRPGAQPVINSLYASLGAELDATVVPAGMAWAALAQVRPDIPLYTDVVHPTLQGSYLAAATFYASMFGQSPVGFAPPAGINAIDARAIQDVAWDVVSGRATAVDRNWVATGIGNWNDPANWAPAAAPVAGDRVALTAGIGENRIINYVSANGASTLLGALNISASGGSVTLRQAQNTLRVAGNVVIGDAVGGMGNYELSGTGRMFAASDEQIVNGSFTQSGGKHIIMQTLSIGVGPDADGSYLLNGGLLQANAVEVNQGGTFTQLGGTLDAGKFVLAGGKVQGVLRNRNVFEYSSGVFQGKLINEGTATLASNGGKVSAQAGGGAQMEIEVSGTDASLVVANADQDLKALTVMFQNPGAQGFDLASADAADQIRSIRIHPDAADFAQVQSGLSAAIGHALTNPGDGIFDSGLDGRPGTRVGLARRLDENQNPMLLMRPTVIGDLNLDGMVTISDFIDLATNFAQPVSSGWESGDIDYDGSVGIGDFIALAANFGSSYTGIVLPASEEEQRLLNEYATSVVPETSGLMMGGLLALLTLAQRRTKIPGYGIIHDVQAEMRSSRQSP